MPLPVPLTPPSKVDVLYSGCAGFDSAHSPCLYSPQGNSCAKATNNKYFTATNYIPTQAHVTNDSCGNNAPAKVPSGKFVVCCAPATP